MKGFVCMIAYTNYAIDARVRREAETLASQGFQVRCLTTKNGADTSRFVPERCGGARAGRSEVPGEEHGCLHRVVSPLPARPPRGVPAAAASAASSTSSTFTTSRISWFWPGCFPACAAARSSWTFTIRCRRPSPRSSPSRRCSEDAALPGREVERAGRPPGDLRQPSAARRPWSRAAFRAPRRSSR